MIAESGGRRLLQYYKQRASGKKEELPLVALEWAELHCQLKDLTSAELTEIVQSLVLCGTLLCGEQSLRDFNSTVLFGLLLSRAKTLPPAKDDQQIIPILRSLFVAPAENDEPHEEHGIDTSLPFFKNLQLCGSFLGVDWNLGKYNIDESVIEMLQKTAAFPYDHQHTKSLIGTLQSRMLWMFPQISVEGFPPRLAWWLNPIQARELNSFLHSSKPVFPDPEDTPGAFLVWCMINDVNIYEIGLWTKSDHGKNVLKWLRIALRSGQPQVFVGSMFAMLSYYRLSCSKDLAVNIRGDFESPSVEYVEWESQGDSEDQQFSISLVNEEDISDLLLTQWNRFLETDEDPGMIIDLVYPSFCRVLMKLIRKTSLHFCKDWISPCHSQSVEAYPKVEEYFKNRLA
ncbi:hypothetical protein CGMCC3_g9863 [Colletotrichum fructicola]|nr:uncharacterized protein CGMCC3_g9863 [Colletotrichum fructicola]KAE9574176.1 hypothetical protein CGMCC3_g9863 [Colletotrichum fructicola]